MEVEFAISCVRKGELPKKLEDKEGMIRAVEKIITISSSMISIILTTARNEDFNDDETKWAKWVFETFGYSKSRRCHYNLVGKMLIGIRERYPECFEQLLFLDLQKNLKIAALFRESGALETKNFLQQRPEKMTRDQVRDAVDVWMGVWIPEKDDKKKQPEPPELETQIFHLNNKFARTEPQKIIEGFSPNTAILAINVGIGCMSAVSAYYKNTGAYKNLSVEQLNKMEAAAQKIFKQFGAWREELATTNLKDAS